MQWEICKACIHISGKRPDSYTSVGNSSFMIIKKQMKGEMMKGSPIKGYVKRKNTSPLRGQIYA